MFSSNLTTYPASPYYDDFKANVDGNGTSPVKNYLRILFRPGRSVQARELTQLQTILQSQINKFGASVYHDGTPVINGLCTMDDMVSWVSFSSMSVTAASLVDTIIRDAASPTPLTARVLGTAVVGGITKLYIKYTNTGLNGTTARPAFLASSALYTSAGAGIGTTSSSSATGTASMISVDNGVYFIAGSFIEVIAQKIFIDQVSGSTPDGFATFNVVETVKSYVDDSNLLDNANGSPNFSAPGADRYNVDLVLEFRTTADWDTLTSAGNTTRVKLLTILNGKVFVKQTTEYSAITDVLAQRTFEESGNYTVRPFQLDIREYDTALDPRGIGTGGNAADKFVVGVEPSVAYVEGYRIALNARKDIPVLKPRAGSLLEYNNADLAFVQSASFGLMRGNYITGVIDTSVSSTSIPNIADTSIQYTFRKYNATAFTGASIGTCRISSIELISGSTYRLYLYDVSISSAVYGANSVTDAFELGNSSTGFRFKASSSVTTATFVLSDSAHDTALFPLPYITVKSLKQSTSANPTITYYTRRRYSGTANGSYQITINASGSGLFSSSHTTDYVCHNVNAHKPIIPTLVAGFGTSSVTLTFASGDATSGDTIQALATAAYTGTQRTKTLTSPSAITLPKAGGSLSQKDIYKIVSIFDTSGTPINVTDRYILDNGQRDTYYTTGSISLKPGAAAPAGTNVTVTFQYFAHGSGDYYSVDSYNTTYVPYGSIPTYKGNRLQDYIDFRPDFGDTSAAQPEPNSVVTTSLYYYLPRIDIVTVDKNGTFAITTGTSATVPATPPTPASSMVLYKLQIPAYVYSVTDIGVTYVDNKRYTMSDIGILERRISKLEYYTSMSLLEQTTNQKQILADNGAQRYKNGFVVDSFVGSSVGNTKDLGYICAIDQANQQLRPFFIQGNVRYFPGTIGGNITAYSNGIAMLKSTDTALITQPYASSSINVNPYNVFSWDGSLKISPSTDVWQDTIRLPDVVINDNSVFDAVTALANNGVLGTMGTVWNSWKTNWTSTKSTGWFGGHKTTGTANFLSDSDGDLDDTFGWHGKLARGITTTTNQTRTGTTTELVTTTVNQSLGDKIVDARIVPYIRSRRVYFKAGLLKPNTKMYAFFDGVPIAAYVGNNNGASGSGTYVEYSALTDTVTLYTNDVGLPSATALKTDASGNLEGQFIIPNNTSLRFKTGDRTFLISDDPLATQLAATTKAEAVYSASGLLQSAQGSIISTRVPKLTQTKVAQNKTTVANYVQYKDPLAQTFVIGDIATGCFITKLDLYFKTKDSNIPVSIQLVDVQNGVPTQNVIPGSQVTLLPGSVNVSDIADTATTFTFDSPIYLKPGSEYAMVVMSMSDGYNVWVSDVGGFDKTNNSGNRISSNPYAGVLFTSQNASTWTPDQTRDLKFTLYRAVFTTSTVDNDIALSDDPYVPSVTVTGLAGSVGQYTLTTASSTSGIIVGQVASAATGVQSNSMVIAVTSTTITLSRPLTQTISAASIEFKAQDGMDASIINVTTQELSFNETTTAWSGAFVGSTYLPISPNENYQFSQRKVFAALSSSFPIKANIKTTSEYVSPVIDLDRVSLIKIDSVINDARPALATATINGGGAITGYTILDGGNMYSASPTITILPAAGDTAGAGAAPGSVTFDTSGAITAIAVGTAGSNYTVPPQVIIAPPTTGVARYVGPDVTLNDPASQLNTYISISRPKNTNVYVYARFQSGATPLSQQPWRLVPLIGIPVIPTSDDQVTFTECEFTLTNLALFTAFTVKIEMTSNGSNPPLVPLIKDFRAIATT